MLAAYRTFASLCLFTFILLAAPGAQPAPSTDVAFPLSDVCARSSICLNGEWDFAKDEGDNGVKQRWYMPSHNYSRWEKAPVPMGYNGSTGPDGVPEYRGVAWYHRKVQAPADWTGDLTLWFMGSYYATDVWVNGQYAGLHKGGDTYFSFELEGLAKPGQEFDLTARIDNRLNYSTVPSQHMHWQPWGGIYRDVFLIEQPETLLADPFVMFSVPVNGQPTMKGTAAACNWSREKFEGTLTAQLLDPDAGNQVVQETQVALSLKPDEDRDVEFELSLPGVKLWSPECPKLYKLKLDWGAGSMEFPVGVRELRIEGTQVLLNNRRIWMQGIAHHEFFNGKPPAWQKDAWHDRLILMRKEYHCNMIRLGHYVNDPDVYRWADELGMLVFTEIPVWQMHNGGALQSKNIWEGVLKPELTEMVVRLRNHPCIFGWGVSNETHNMTAYFRQSIELIRELDSTRFVQPVFDAMTDLNHSRMGDLDARNLHYGWYHSDNIYELRNAMQTLESALGDMPLYVAELGAMSELGNLNGGYGDFSKFSETYHDKLVRFGMQYCPTMSNLTCGITVWCWADLIMGGSYIRHGIMDMDEKPKLCAYAVRNLLEGDVRLYISEISASVIPGWSWRANLVMFNPELQQIGPLKARYWLLKGSKVLMEGAVDEDIYLSQAERSKVLTRVEWNAPDDAEPGMYAFWAELYDQDGKRIYTNSSYFDVGKPSRPGILQARVLCHGEPVEGATMQLSGVEIPVYRHPGLLIPLEEGEYRLIFSAPGLQNQERAVKISRGGRTELDVELAP
ncbi:hypothetical protein JXA32_09590 [Candidatus Sumerlaeota bacterium]|nr:hypothetical protein [Candidatus Sumerlaeota bacterium]